MTKTVEEWMNEWLEVYIKPCRSENTYLCYKYLIIIIKKFSPKLAKKLLPQVTEMEIQKLINSMAAKYAKSTLIKIRLIFNMSFESAVRNYLCEKNPIIHISIPNARVKNVKSLTPEEQEKLEFAAKQDKLGHIVIFLLNTGLRACELIHLTWSDYDDKKSEIHICKSKTKSGIRTVPLNQKAKKIIEAQPHVSDYIFTSTTHNPLTPTVLKRLYMRMRKLTGIKTISNHVYRHTFATRLVEHHVDYKALSTLLGHSNVAFTINCYPVTEGDFLHKQIELLD